MMKDYQKPLCQMLEPLPEAPLAGELDGSAPGFGDNDVEL